MYVKQMCSRCIYCISGIYMQYIVYTFSVQNYSNSKCPNRTCFREIQTKTTASSSSSDTYADSATNQGRMQKLFVRGWRDLGAKPLAGSRGTASGGGSRRRSVKPHESWTLLRSCQSIRLTILDVKKSVGLLHLQTPQPHSVTLAAYPPL